MSRQFRFLFLFAVLLIASKAVAVTPDFVENFASPGTSGWTGGTSLSNPQSGGVDGATDGYLLLSNQSAQNFGAKNTGADYTGNWTAAGIAQVRFSLNDVPPAQAFQFHFLLTSGSTTWQFNTGFAPPLNQWQQYSVDVTSSANWTPIRGIASFPQTLQSIDTVHFRQDVPPFDASSDPIAGELGIDQIMLLTAQWYSSAGGNWSDASNWAGPIPNAPDASANLLRRALSPANISLTSPITVGHVIFDNANSYTISGAPTLTLQTTAADASITVRNGEHTIAAPLLLNSNATISGVGSLTTGSITNSSVLTVRTSLTTGDIDGAGSITVGDATAAGSLSAAHIRQTSLTLGAGSNVAIRSAGTDASLSILNSLSIAPTATLDLKNNDLLIHADSSTAASDMLKQLTDDLGTGRLFSSMATSNIVLAVAINDDNTGNPIQPTFHSQQAGVNDLLVKYTYGGDTNFDGLVNADDYGNIDRGFISQKPGWFNGDFNYDGIINADDYGSIDRAFIGQSGQLSRSVISAAAVPEPSILLLVSLIIFGAGATRAGRSRSGLQSSAPEWL